MLDDHTLRVRIIRAALARAEADGWHALKLADVAREAGIGIAELAREFQTKTDILEAFQREVDQTVLQKADVDMDEAARDRLFDVIMTRLEVLGPYKGALKRIIADMQTRPGAALRILCQSARSHAWMLRAADIDPDGPSGPVRVSGLMSVTGQVLHVWLEDDDPGLAKTMAALDRRLRRGERWLQRIDGLGAAACRVLSSLKPRRSTRAEDDPVAPGTNGAAEPSTS